MDDVQKLQEEIKSLKLELRKSNNVLEYFKSMHIQWMKGIKYLDQETIDILIEKQIKFLRDSID